MKVLILNELNFTSMESNFPAILLIFDILDILILSSKFIPTGGAITLKEIQKDPKFRHFFKLQQPVSCLNGTSHIFYNSNSLCENLFKFENKIKSFTTKTLTFKNYFTIKNFLRNLLAD